MKCYNCSNIPSSIRNDIKLGYIFLCRKCLEKEIKEDKETDKSFY